MLRASSKVGGTDVDLHSVMGGDASNTGVAHGELLLAFAEAAVAAANEAKEANGALASARAALLSATHHDLLVDAAAVVGNFERMVRIADGTGIPVDKEMNALTAGMREDLGIDRFASARNTAEVSGAAKAAGRLAQAALLGVMKWVTQLRRGRSDAASGSR